jgi:serine/threonine-protein kinase
MSVLYIQGEEEKRQHIHYEVDTDIPALGEGGMGQVLRGVRVNEQNGLRQDVAIKFLFDDLPPNAIERARREASIQIHNENLVEMFGFIEIADNQTKHFHVVSELLSGVMLFDLLNGKTTDKYGNEVEFAQELYNQYQNDRFGFAVFIVKNILSGLMALHDKGYIHRDLDPSNIMITHDRKVKIIDFGIAKQLTSLNTQDQQLTSTGQFIGKAAYAAPELVLGDVHSQNRTTDIYAVGIMLFQFVVGTLPFEGTMAELIDQQLKAKMPLKMVPFKAIRRIIEKATAKKQADRYQSAAEMRVDMEHLTRADATPSKTFFGNTTPKTSTDKKVAVGGGGNKKLGLIIGAAAAAIVVLVGIGVGAYFIFSGSSGLSEAELEQQRQDSIAAVKQAAQAKEKKASALVSKALAALDDPATVEEGFKQMENIVSQYASSKSAAQVTALMAALLQPQDVFYSPEKIKILREQTADFVEKSASKAHSYAEKAVEADPACYQALYELATDYMTGEPRTGSTPTDLEKSKQLFEKGQQYAQQKGDDEYIDLFKTRIEQVKGLIEQSKSESNSEE